MALENIMSSQKSTMVHQYWESYNLNDEFHPFVTYLLHSTRSVEKILRPIGNGEYYSGYGKYYRMKSQVYATFQFYWMLNLGLESRSCNKSNQFLTNATPNTQVNGISSKYGNRCISTNLICRALQKKKNVSLIWKYLAESICKEYKMDWRYSTCYVSLLWVTSSTLIRLIFWWFWISPTPNWKIWMSLLNPVL